MQRTREEGLFEISLEGKKEFFAYQLEVENHQSQVHVQRDLYSFWPILADEDRYLFNEGKHYNAHRFLGARFKQVDGIEGVYFSVWAPSARRVSVVGDFNSWDGRRHGLRPLGDSGIWEIFLPGLVAGAVYKYEILGQSGELLLKCDPFAFAAEVPPQTGSIVAKAGPFEWGDEQWVKGREEKTWVEEAVT